MSKFQERVNGPTPNGGDYMIAEFHDATGAPCTKDKAVTVEVKEYNVAGTEIHRTYGEVVTDA